MHRHLRDGICSSSQVTSYIRSQKIHTDFCGLCRGVIEPPSKTKTDPRKKHAFLLSLTQKNLLSTNYLLGRGLALKELYRLEASV